MKYLKSILITILGMCFISCIDTDSHFNAEINSTTDSLESVEPKFIIYEGELTEAFNPSYPELCQADSVVLKLSVDFKQVTLNGQMKEIKEIQDGVYAIGNDSVSAISIYPKKDFLILYGACGEPLATIYKTELEY